jgi:positive regulator of sigma E activity
MTRTGIVVEVSGDRALISLSGSAECGSCASKHACFGLSGHRGREISYWIANDAGASPGDTVELELAPGATIKAIAITFLLPVVFLAAGYLLMSGGGEASRAAGAGGGLLAGIFLSIPVNSRLSRREVYDMHMVRVSTAAGCPGREG